MLYRFLKRYDIPYKQEFDYLNEVKDYANSVIEKIIELSNDTENIDMSNFDYRAMSYFNAKNLKPITDFDFAFTCLLRLFLGFCVIIALFRLKSLKRRSDEFSKRWQKSLVGNG